MLSVPHRTGAAHLALYDAAMHAATLAPIDHPPAWRAESGAAAPRRVVAADDTTSADTAYRLACEGTGLLWQGDFQNARQLLQALARRTERKPKKNKKPEPTSPLYKPSTCTAKPWANVRAFWPW